MNLHQKEKYGWKDLSMLKFFNLVNRHILMFENDLSPFFQRRLSTWQLWVVVREKKERIDLLGQLLSPRLNARVHGRARNRGYDKKKEQWDINSQWKKKKIYPELTVYNSLCKSLKETYIRWPQRKNTLSLFLLIFFFFFEFDVGL